MKFSWNSGRLTVATAVVYLCGANATLARPQETRIVTSAEAQKQTHSVADKDAAYYQQFLDKEGGYKDSKGGYYNPKAGTYTDEAGGVVDNWSGYTYKNGSYKTKFGDYYDAKENVFKLTDGQTIKGEAGITAAKAIQTLREDVEQRGGFDKEFIRNSMMQQIKSEHPNPPHR